MLFFFFVVFNCEPVSKFWKPWISGHCFNIFAISIVTAVINAVSDIMIVILPQPIIWKLQISIKRKLGLSAIILVGVLWVECNLLTLNTVAQADISSACVSSALRVNYSVKLARSEDKTYHTFLLALFSFSELTFGILAMCSPIIPKFFGSFQNLRWPRSNSFLHSITRSNINSRTSGAQFGKSKAVKLGDGSSSFHAALTDNISLSDEIESATKNKTGERIQENHRIGQSQQLQIMRTVHIATTYEVDTASTMPDFDNQTSRISYGYRRHEYPPMRSQVWQYIFLECYQRLIHRTPILF